MTENNEEETNTKEERSKAKDDLGWQYCANCGTKLPAVKNIRFCTACGLDLRDLKENLAYPQEPAQYYSIPEHSRQYVPSASYFPQYKQLSDEEILATKDEKLWGTGVSIWLPLLAFVLMNLIIAGVIVVLMFIVFDINVIYNLITNPFFLILSSTVELVLILFPTYYVRKYLRNPTFKNRLKILGFTREGFDNKQVGREVLIGVLFGLIGLFIVAGVSVAVELILYYGFGISIIRSEDSPTSDVEILISGADIIAIILLVAVMMLVVGTSEEILFRGFMQKGLVRNLGDKAGILITAFIFAIIHLVALFIIIPSSPLTFVVLFVLLFAPYFAISLMLGLLFRWRGENLIAVMITHGVYNSITVVLAFIFLAS